MTQHKKYKVIGEINSELEFFSDSSFLITGVCGTVGLSLMESLVDMQKNLSLKIIGIDINESFLFLLKNKFSKNPNVVVKLCDVRNQKTMKQVLEGVDYVIHCAAYKHVGIGDESPSEVVNTNIIALENLIDQARTCGVKKFIFTSSDKAVNPTNTMGATKLIGEKIIAAANSRASETIFASVRFGNVLGSSGSVVPIFYHQILSGTPVTLTDESMTRFVMSCRNCVLLIIRALAGAEKGDIFVAKMPSVRIKDLAIAMLIKYGGVGRTDAEGLIKISGVRPGEKLYEELASSEEETRLQDRGDFFVLKAPSKEGDPEYVNYPSIGCSFISSEHAHLDIAGIHEILNEVEL